MVLLGHFSALGRFLPVLVAVMLLFGVQSAEAERLCKMGSHATAPFFSASMEKAKKRAEENLVLACHDKGGHVQRPIECTEIFQFGPYAQAQCCAECIIDDKTAASAIKPVGGVTPSVSPDASTLSSVEEIQASELNALIEGLGIQ